MGTATYKSLHQMVVEEIESRTTYSQGLRGSDQLKRNDIAPLTGNALSDITSAAIVNSIQTLLAGIIKPRIISGLHVRATSPISSNITVEIGTGVSYGRYYELREETTLTIPFDSKTEVFYVVLFDNTIMVDRNYDNRKLILAKIIVPRPNIHTYIRDSKSLDDAYDAYIVNQFDYDLHGNKYGKFEEDTVELLRDNISPILADNLIGNIRLTEDLKIINSSGTLELDSREMRLKSTSGNRLMRLNKNGTFFYDENGVEIAKFSVEGARVGNIVVTKSSIQSGDFVSGALGAGFQIQDNGDAEFNNIRARGKFTTSVFEKETISSVGGNLLVSDSDILDLDMTALDSSTLTISGDTTFSVGDILRIKDGVDDEWFEVTNVSSAPTYVVTRDKAGEYTSDINPIWKKGTAVINYGSSTDGMIYMTASEANAPYMSVINTGTTPWIAPTTRLRIGNLNGFLGYTEDAYGTAIGDTDNYLKYDPVNGLRIKGNVIITGGTSPSGINSFSQSATLSGEGVPTSLAEGDLWFNTDDNRWYRAESVGADEITAGEWVLSLTGLGAAPSIGSGLYLSADYMGYFDGGEWTSYIKNDGTFYFGSDTDSGNSPKHVCWDGINFCIRGELVADDIQAGTICLSRGITIESNPLESGTSGCTIFNTSGIYSYDSNGVAKFSVVDGHIEAQDLRLQDPNCDCCYSFLSAGALKFHDECGDVPYVKRILSGTANTGCTVCLPGWKTEPKIQVSINTLYSYNAAQSAQNQQWSVYYDNVSCYCNSGNDYGYQFDVHSELRLASGQGSECITSVNWGTSVCTATCTCSTKVRSKFYMWCNGAAPSNYYAGCLCYRICYRVVGAGSYCCYGDYSYLQPHASESELKSMSEQTQTLNFCCMATWEILTCCIGLSWHDTGICSSGSGTCCVITCCTATNCNWSCCIYKCCVNASYSATFTAPLSWSGGWCGAGWTCFCGGSSGTISGYTYVNVTIQDDPFSTRKIETTSNTYYAFICGLCGTGTCCDSTGSGALTVGVYGYNSIGHTWAADFCWNLCYSGYYCWRCYCCTYYTGDAASCCLFCNHSLCNTYGCYCVLDASGVLNWIAISYN